MRTDSSSSRPSTARKRTWTRDQLLRNLEIIGPLHTPLPPTLPPSPPVSRSNSPAPGPIKRKFDASADLDHFKRPRTSSILSDRPPHHLRRQSFSSHPHPPHLRLPADTPLHAARNEPCEDGEVYEDLPVASSSRLPAPPPFAIPPNMLPIRRPKRGKTDIRHHDLLNDKYHIEGRMLKYSGDARFWSTYPVTHREYRPLSNPPPPNSDYYRHGGLIARLELVDALVCFTFALWNRDYRRRTCQASWSTVGAFLSWCKQKWLAEEGMIDSEKAFIGLIFMIEGFIHGRKLAYSANNGAVDKDITSLYESLKQEVDSLGHKAENMQLSAENVAQATPPMLPSPASIAPANSANSTPASARDAATPNPLATEATAPAPQRPAHPATQTLLNGKMLPDRYKDKSIPAHVMDAMLTATTTVSLPVVQHLREQNTDTTGAAYCMIQSQTSLNLTTLRLHFPTTFARVINTTLSPTEEHEPDFEDEQGELFWPGQSITGEGLGWVCLLGKAMIKEFGKAYGYRGLVGVVPKPKPEEAPSNAGPPPQGPSQHQQRPGSTPHGHTPHGYSSQSASSTVPR